MLVSYGYKLVLALAIRIRTHIGHTALFRNTDFLYLLIDKQTRRDELAKAKKDRGRRIARRKKVEGLAARDAPEGEKTQLGPLSLE